MCTIYYRSALGIRPRGSYSVSKNSMEAARKIRAVQFIFTSLPGELPGEGFTSYAFFFFPSPLLLKSHLKCASWSILQLLWTYPYFFVVVGQGPESLCDCSLMLI